MSQHRSSLCFYKGKKKKKKKKHESVVVVLVNHYTLLAEWKNTRRSYIRLAATTTNTDDADGAR